MYTVEPMHPSQPTCTFLPWLIECVTIRAVGAAPFDAQTQAWLPLSRQVAMEAVPTDHVGRAAIDEEGSNGCGATSIVQQIRLSPTCVETCCFKM